MLEISMNTAMVHLRIKRARIAQLVIASLLFSASVFLLVVLAHGQDRANAQTSPGTISVFDSDQNRAITELHERQIGLVDRLQRIEAEQNKQRDTIQSHDKMLYVPLALSGVGAFSVMVLTLYQMAQQRKVITVPKELRNQCSENCPIAQHLEQMDPRDGT